ncbi:FecR domain-containing protein [Treponema sp.]|uniref:FecR family protein n=1 Tax=Treponema sp. TaxID=166 RepID=UPI00298E4CA5|nr:FecR domain-containing protein [Treponema sp.]MCQ2241586.1 FecR domain-containing protein [Treponema sp.]
MKKFIALAIVSFAVFCASALTATVVSVKGKVEIQEAGMWVSLQKGDVLEKGTVISTGFNSEAVLNVSNSSISLGPLTRVTIENLVSTKDKDTTQIYIDSGSLAANVSGKDGKRAGFKVRSPVATASVRGTSFVVSSSGKLTVTEGLVAFGAAESEGPSVVEDSPAEAEAPAEAAPVAAAETSDSSAEAPAAENTDEGHANAFASTADVGGEGVPVAAGQSSKASSSGSSPSSPRAEMAKTAVGGKDNTVTVSAQNSVASGSSSSSSSAVAAQVSAAVSTTPVRTTGSISVAVSFAD